MNPFEGKSLTELLDGVPGYADPELNALCACVCDEEWVEFGAYNWIYCDPKRTYLSGYCAVIKYPTDWREAGRLLEKYRLRVTPAGKKGWWVHDGNFAHCSAISHDNPCRAITEAAVTAALTKMIDAKPSNK